MMIRTIPLPFALAARQRKPGIVRSFHVEQSHIGQQRYAKSNRSALSPVRHFTSTSVLSAPLHAEWIGADKNESKSSPIVFLHGLLGNGRNVKSMATQLCQDRPGILLDATGHGKSKGLRSSPVSFDDCTEDMESTLQNLESFTGIGHSLGGRLCLHYAASTKLPKPKQIWLLDTVPGNVDSGVYRVLKLAGKVMEEAKGSPNKMARSQVTEQLHKTHGLDLMTAQWLASSWNPSKKEFGFDYPVALDLVHSLKEQDFMGLLKSVIDAGDVRVDLVMGGKNKAWEESGVLTKLQSLEGSKFGLHSLPKAGHWVHVDDLAGLVTLIQSVTVPA